MIHSKKWFSIFLFLIFTLFLIPQSELHADIKGDALEKVRVELIEELKDRGYPEIASHFNTINPSEWGTYAGRIASGEARMVFEELLQEKRYAILNDLYAKAKDYARDIVGPEVIRWLESAELHKDALKDIANKTYAGDFEGAGDTFWLYAKEKVQAEVKARVKEFSLELIQNSMDFVLKEIVDLSVGEFFLKTVELEIMAIEVFEKWTTEYFSKFQVNRLENGRIIEVEHRTLCKQYKYNRKKMGWSPDEAMEYNPDGFEGAPAPLSTIVIKGGYYFGNYFKDNRYNDPEIVQKNLEAKCYIQSQISKSVVDKVVDKSRDKENEFLFRKIKKGMEKAEDDIITILDEFGQKFPSEFELQIKVVDKTDGHPLDDVLVFWDDNSDKTNKDGLITENYKMDKLDSKGDWLFKAIKSGYVDAYADPRFKNIKSMYSATTNTVVVELAMEPLEKIRLRVFVFEKEDEDYDEEMDKFPIRNAIVIADFREEHVATSGETSFEYNYPELVLARTAGIKDLELKASASGYKTAIKRVSIDDVISVVKFGMEARVSIVLEKETPKSFKLIVDLVDANTGKKIIASGTVKPDHQKEKATKNGSSSFLFKISELKNHALLGMTNIVINATVSGYKQKGAVTVTAKKLLEENAAKKTSLTITVPMLIDPSASIDRFEVKCDKPEIFEDQAASCVATVYDKTGKATNVSRQVNWALGYVDLASGKVEGAEVAKVEALPYTVNILATFVASKQKGGNKWTAKESVLVKSRKGLAQPGITVSKSPDKFTITTGDHVTYSYQVKNPGNVPIAKLIISDDKCSPVKHISGDSNQDGKLDPNESWLYECTMSLNKDTINRVTVTGEDASGKKVTDSATATVIVLAANPCPPPKVLVPTVIGRSEAIAKRKLKKLSLTGVVVQKQYSETYPIDSVILQSPLQDECVDKNSVVNLWVSGGPEVQDEPEQSEFTAVFSCGNSFEIVAGAPTGKSCGITVRGWQDISERVEVRFSYSNSSNIVIFPRDTSVAPYNMFNPGVADNKGSYIIGESIRAKKNAPTGITTITMTVSQKGVGSVTLSTDVFVLPEGSTVSSECGIRPPAVVTSGSGGEYCVWRMKMSTRNPRCFWFRIGKCADPQYYYPKYELLGTDMTVWEANKRRSEFSFVEDPYGCRDRSLDCPEDSDGDGTSDKDDACPKDPNKTSPGKCGCYQSDRDLDNDKIPDCLDDCTKGIDRDSDNDGVPDCEDECPTNIDREKPDDVCNSCWPYDTDEDKVLDCNDECPYDKNKTEPLHCGCNNLETDTDGDLWPDCIDECPDNPDLTALPDDIEVILKKIDAEIQPARKALHDCEGMSIFSDLRAIKTRLTKIQCNSAKGISERLKEIDRLEKTIDPENCSGKGKKECDIAPITTADQVGKRCSISQRFWGTDGASHCLAEDEITALRAKDGTTVTCSGTCTKCPEGFSSIPKAYNGSKGCFKCPEGTQFSNGCCR